MLIDIIVFCVMMIAIFKGYNKGMVATLFSFLAIVVGFVIALKCSALVATWLQKSTHIPSFWLPFIAFIIIVVAIIFIAKICTGFVENLFQIALLGWFNKLCGIVIYVALYAIVLSGFLFFLEKMTILKPETIMNSKTYQFIQPIAPKVISFFGNILPFVKESFQQLEGFFKVNTTS